MTSRQVLIVDQQVVALFRVRAVAAAGVRGVLDTQYMCLSRTIIIRRRYATLVTDCETPAWESLRASALPLSQIPNRAR